MAKQEEIYKNIWYPMEERFGHSEGADYFDRFMRDYLTIKTGQIPNIRDVYTGFKEFFTSQNKSLDVISDIYYFSDFYTKIVFEKEEDPQLNSIIRDINILRVDTAYPFLLEVLVDYDKGKLSRKEITSVRVRWYPP